MRKLSLALALAAGCGGADSHSGMLIDPGPVPENGMQIILPIQKGIKAGSDNELCTWTNIITDRDLMVKAIQGIQSETGHHVVVYKTKSYEPAWTTRPCREDDLASFRFVGGAGGEGVMLKNTAPGNVVFSIEKGYQIVINEHFLNASPKDHDGQSAVNFDFAKPGEKTIPSGAVTLVDTKMKIPEGQGALTVDCKLERSFRVWLAIPHMHRWGSHIKIEHTSQTGKVNSLFNLSWDPKYTFEAPELRGTPESPIMFEKGDRIKVDCQWNNDTGKPLTFGPEMCVFFAQTIDDDGQGNWACDRDEWVSY